MAEKQTLYEILGVSPTATLAEIKAAHHALTRALVGGETGLPRDEVQFKLQVLDMALNTLTAPWSRDAYDAELRARAPANRNLPAVSASNPLAQSPTFNAVVVADALHQSYKTALAGSDNSLVVFAESAAASASALKKVLRALVGLFVLFVISRCSMGLYMNTHQSELYAKEKAKAEDMVVIQDYYQKHGIRPASRAEAEMLEQQAQREQDEANRIASEQRQQEERDRQFADQARREGERVSRNVEIAQAQAREQEERERREAEWAKQQAEEKQRMEEERAQLQGRERAMRDEQLARQRAHEGQWRQPAYSWQ